MIVVLFADADVEPTLEPAALEELAKLGVTSAALVRDSSTAGLVLEGWAFDLRDAYRAARAVGGASDGVRTLRPLVQMAVSSVALVGERAVPVDFEPKERQDEQEARCDGLARRRSGNARRRLDC